MVHGWPSLWHSWKYQIEEFKVCLFPHNPLCGYRSTIKAVAVVAAAEFMVIVAALMADLPSLRTQYNRMRDLQRLAFETCFGVDVDDFFWSFISADFSA